MTFHEPWEETEPRMYSAGYHSGKRLAHVAELATRKRETDEYLIRLGANAYAEGFEDGHAGRPARLTLHVERT